MKKWLLAVLTICLVASCALLCVACDEDTTSYTVSFDKNEHVGMSLSSNMDSDGAWSNPVSKKDATWSVWLAPYYDINQLQIFANDTLIPWTKQADLSEYENGLLDGGPVKVGTLTYSEISEDTVFTMSCSYVSLKFKFQIVSVQDEQLVNEDYANLSSDQKSLLEMITVTGTGSSGKLSSLISAGTEVSIGWNKLVEKSGIPQFEFITGFKWRTVNFDTVSTYFNGEKASNISEDYPNENYNRYVFGMSAMSLLRTETNVLALDVSQLARRELYIESNCGTILQISGTVGGVDATNNRATFTFGQQGDIVIQPNVKSNVDFSQSELYIGQTKVEWTDNDGELSYTLHVGSNFAPVNYYSDLEAMSYNTQMLYVSIKNVQIADNAPNFTKIVGLNDISGYWDFGEGYYVEYPLATYNLTLLMPIEITDKTNKDKILTITLQVSEDTYTAVITMPWADISAKLTIDENEMHWLSEEVVFDQIDTTQWLPSITIDSCVLATSGSSFKSGEEWSVGTSLQLCLSDGAAGTITISVEDAE